MKLLTLFLALTCLNSFSLAQGIISYKSQFKFKKRFKLKNTKKIIPKINKAIIKSVSQ